MQLTPGRYRLEQDHPGHGHSGVPGRTGPACGRPQTNKFSLNSALHVEALLLHAESSNCRKGSDDRVRGFPQQRVVFLRCDVGAAVRAALKVGERTA